MASVEIRKFPNFLEDRWHYGRAQLVRREAQINVSAQGQEHACRMSVSPYSLNLNSSRLRVDVSSKIIFLSRSIVFFSR
jgi:hypothetical protein